jgi:rhodanese-related sulfurtransferase
MGRRKCHRLHARHGTAKIKIAGKTTGEFRMNHTSRFAQLTADAKSRIREVTPAQAHEEQAQGAVLIDVRETDEFMQGHAKGAVHLSKGLIELRIEDAVPDTSTPIVCYCGGGSRSALAADNLQKMGYTNVASMSGGMKQWRGEGLPME